MFKLMLCYCILNVLGILIGSALLSQPAWAELEANPKPTVEAEEEPCYVEQEILRRLPEFQKSDTWTAKQEQELISLLPYIIYNELHRYLLGLDDKEYTQAEARAECLRTAESYLRHGVHIWIIRGQIEMLGRAAVAYQARYAQISRPPISKDEVPVYEAKANEGDLQAMLELRRHYDFPDDDYDPERTHARYWLYKAVEAGDKDAMLEAGYDRPYSVRTNLSRQGVTIAMDVGCEGVVQTGPSPGPACFIYNLLIGESPGQVGHIVLDQDHLSGLSMRPKRLALKESDGRIMVELTSGVDSNPTLTRRDYFDLEANYLGSDAANNPPGYFWYFRLASPSIPNTVIDATGWSETANIEIRKWPYAEAFLFWEQEYKEKRLKALDELGLMPGSSAFYGPGITDEECNEYSNKAWQRHYRDEVYYERMNKLIKLDLYTSPSTIKDAIIKITGRKKYDFVEFDFKRYTCDYIIPRLILKDVFVSLVSTENIYQAYEKLSQRPSYIIEHGSEVENIRMLKICRYLGSYTAESSLCYAIQVRFKTNNGFKYHYVITNLQENYYKNVAKKFSTDYITDLNVMFSKIYITTGQFDGKTYIILGNKIYHNLTDRIDMFSDEFNYLGSTDFLLSNLMTQNSKILPIYLLKQIKYRFNRVNIVQQFPNSEQDFLYPQLSDIFIEYSKILNK